MSSLYVVNETIHAESRKTLRRLDDLIAAVQANTVAVQEAARTPQRVIHVPGPRGGHHADSRPAVPAALRQR